MKKKHQLKLTSQENLTLFFYQKIRFYLIKKFLQRYKKCFFIFYTQNKNKEVLGSKSASTKSENEQTSINFSNETESIKKQEPKTQVNIVISYIEKNDEQGIGQLVKIHSITQFIKLMSEKKNIFFGISAS